MNRIMIVVKQDQELEERKNVKVDLDQKLEKKNVGELDLNHEKKSVEEQNLIQKNVKLKKGVAALDLGLVKEIIKNDDHAIENMSHQIKINIRVIVVKRYDLLLRNYLLKSSYFFI